MRQIWKIVGQIFREHGFVLICFVCLHRLLFYGGLRLFYGLPLGERLTLWGWLFSGDFNMVTCFGFLFLGCFVGFFILWEIAAYLLLYESCGQRRVVSLLTMILGGMGQGARVFRREPIWLLFVLLFVLPFQAVMTWSGLYLSVEIPGFALQFLTQYPALLLLGNLLFLLVQWLGVESLFFFHFLFLKRKSAAEAWRSSRQMGLWRLGLTCFCLLLWNLCWLLGSFLCYLGGAAVAFLLSETAIALALVDGAEKLILLLQQCFFVPMSVAVVHSCYLVFFSGGDASFCPAIFPAVKRKFVWLLGTVVVLGVVGVFYLSEWDVAEEDLSPVPIVAAHRGYGDILPENTIAAVVAAKKAGVGCIEIDTQMTKDGKMILFHDRDLTETLAVAKTVGELTYAEIAGLVEEIYGGLPKGERPLPLLEEALNAGGSEMLWNVEIKTYTSRYFIYPIPWLWSHGSGEADHKERAVGEVLALLEESGAADRVWISSLDYQVLQLVKEKKPHIKTLYLLPFVGSHLENLSAADGYSIEITALSPEVYRELKNMGKDLWVWTVNDISAAAKLFSYEADGVITDRPLLLKRVLERKEKIHRFSFS